MELISAMANARTRSERDAVIEKFGRRAIGEMQLKLNYIKKQLEELQLKEKKSVKRNRRSMYSRLLEEANKNRKSEVL